jgi:hypothetical protein
LIVSRSQPGRHRTDCRAHFDELLARGRGSSRAHVEVALPDRLYHAAKVVERFADLPGQNHCHQQRKRERDGERHQHSGPDLSQQAARSRYYRHSQFGDKLSRSIPDWSEGGTESGLKVLEIASEPVDAVKSDRDGHAVARVDVARMMQVLEALFGIDSKLDDVGRPGPV